MNTELLLTAKYVAPHLGVVKDTVYRWRTGLRAHRIGRFWKFELSGVDEWVEWVGAGSAHEVTASDQSTSTP